jgi:hypothetical protein
MRMASRLCMAALALLVTAGASPAVETLKSGDVISGRLRLVQTKHPNGTPIRAYQIVSDAPKIFERKDDFCGDAPPQTFHLAGERDKALIAKLKRLTGKKVAVIADVPGRLRREGCALTHCRSTRNGGLLSLQSLEMPLALQPGQQQQARQSGQRADHKEPHPAGLLGDEARAR